MSDAEKKSARAAERLSRLVAEDRLFFAAWQRFPPLRNRVETEDTGFSVVQVRPHVSGKFSVVIERTSRVRKTFQTIAGPMKRVVPFRDRLTLHVSPEGKILPSRK